jgi:hypothetical protein
MYINARETRSGVHEWTIYRYCQHWTSQTIDENKENTENQTQKANNKNVDITFSDDVGFLE